MARKKVGKFSALVGMIAVTTMLMVCFVAAPAFGGATAGKVFSVVWLLVALISFAAFGEKVFARKSPKNRAPVYLFNVQARTVPKVSKGTTQKGI